MDGNAPGDRGIFLSARRLRGSGGLPIRRRLSRRLTSGFISINLESWKRQRHLQHSPDSPRISFARARTEIAPYLIVMRLEEYDYPGAMALAVILLVVSFSLLAVINSLERWVSRFER